MKKILVRLGALFAALALVLPLVPAGPAAAQIDLGNDGVDRDCADFFELNAAQAYFETDGGGAERNVDNLDPTGDGRACEGADQAIEDTGDGGTVTLDADSDGLSDEEELELGTDPSDSDSDNDRLSDGFEAREFGTNPLAADSDEDGLGDGDELETYRTDPLRADSDGDGVDDATEIDAGSDPNDPNSVPGGEDPTAAPTSTPDDDDPTATSTATPNGDDPTPATTATPDGDDPTRAPTSTAVAGRPTVDATRPAETPAATAAPALGSTLAATLEDTDGTTVAVALLAEGTEGDGEVTVGVVAVGLAPGAHGIHIHETGVCDPAGDRAFASAGGHYNPMGAQHGRHAGDLGNITAAAAGTATFQEATDNFDLEELRDGDGAAIVIHAEEDENDPAGESYGARIACGVLAAPAGDATPAA